MKKLEKKYIKIGTDILITVGNNAKYIARSAKNLGMKEKNIFICDTNKTAIDKVKSIMMRGDCILVKASLGMNFKEIVEAL